MSGNQFQFALVFRSDTAAGKAGLTDLASTFKQVTAEGDKVSASAKKQAADLQALAAASAKAMVDVDALAAAERRAQEARAKALIAPLVNPGASFAPMVAAFKATETAAGSLRGTVSGLTTNLSLQTREMVETALAGQTYRESLDDIRASFNPLFAAQRQYEQQLQRIDLAQEMTALSADEATAARLRAAQVLAASQGRLGVAGAPNPYTANIGAQGFDIGVTAAMGMNPAMIGLQQGPQLAGIAQQMGGGAKAAKELATGVLSIFNPTSLVVIGLTTLAAVGIQALMGLQEKTKTWDENLGDLDETLGRMKTNLERVGNVRLSDTFGNLTHDVRSLAQGLVELDRAAELKSFEDVIAGFLDSEVNPSLGQRYWQLLKPGIMVDAPRTEERLQAENYAAMGAANSFADFEARSAEIEKLSKAGDIPGVTAALVALQQAMSGGGAASDMSDDLLKLLAGLTEAGIKTAEIEALLNGSARAESQRRQTDQIVLGYSQEAELQLASLQFGEASVEVERIKARQARDLLAIRLEEQGILAGSENYARAMVALEDRQLAIEEAAREARKDRVRDQDDQIAGIQREITLIGASNAARTRANALAAADIEIRKRKLQGQEAEEERARAIAKAEAEIALEHRKSMQSVLEASMMDIYDGRVADERDPIIRAAIEAEKAYAEAMLATGDATYAAAEAERVRLKAFADAEREKRKALEGITTAGIMDGFDAVLAAERNPYTRAALEAEKEYARVLAETQDAELAAASAARVRAKALGDVAREQSDYLRGQAEAIGQLQLELALVGQTEAVRARVLALAQAERDILRLGATGTQAEEIRSNALAIASQTRELEANADAWKRVQSAGETALDAVFDKLRTGDIAGAFEEMLGELEAGLFDLAVRNPFKNALFGTNLGTLQDVGGLSGIWGRLTGKNKVDEAALATSAASVAAMTVTATHVTLSTSGLSGLGAGLGGSGLGGTAGATMGAFTGLSGSGDVQSKMWAFFAAKGLKPHQIAAIMGNAHAESGFDPYAKGDKINGQYTSFGLFQHHKGRADGLLSATGGMGGLGNVEAQLEYVWRELLTSESGTLKKLLSAGTVQEATAAFVGYERPQGWSANNPTGAHNWNGRLGAAEAALAKFGTTATEATGDLGGLGKGFNAFGSWLNTVGKGGEGGGGAGLVGFIGALLNIPGFAGGGDHRGGLRIVGEHGPELEATGASRIFTAAQTRDILTSRTPVPAISGSQGNGFGGIVVQSAAPIVTVQNHSAEPIRQQSSQGPNGESVIELIVGRGLSRGRYDKQLGSRHGLTPEIPKR